MMSKQRKAFPRRISNSKAFFRARVIQLEKSKKERKRQREEFEALRKRGK